MAFRKADLADVYMALEQVLGSDTGINGFAYQVEGMIGAGARAARQYFVIVQQLITPFTSGHPFGVVAVTIVPGIPRHSAILEGTYYATLDAAVAGCQPLVAAVTPETSTVPGAMEALNV